MPEMLPRALWPFWAAGHYNDGGQIVRPQHKGELKPNMQISFFILFRRRRIKKNLLFVM